MKKTNVHIVTDPTEEVLSPAVQEWIRLINLGLPDLIRLTAIEAAKAKGVPLTGSALKEAGFRPEIPVIACYSGLIGLVADSTGVSPPKAKEMLDYLLMETMKQGRLAKVSDNADPADFDDLIKDYMSQTHDETRH